MIQLVISPEAERDIEWFSMYVYERWGLDGLHKLEVALDNTFRHIQRNPLSFPLADHPVPMHKVLAHKNMLVFYRYFETQGRVEVVRVFDTRQNADNLWR